MKRESKNLLCVSFIALVMLLTRYRTTYLFSNFYGIQITKLVFSVFALLMKHTSVWNTWLLYGYEWGNTPLGYEHPSLILADAHRFAPFFLYLNKKFEQFDELNKRIPTSSEFWNSNDFLRLLWELNFEDQELTPKPLTWNFFELAHVLEIMNSQEHQTSQTSTLVREVKNRPNFKILTTLKCAYSAYQTAQISCWGTQEKM
jgi:hypothetical protein